MFLLVAILNRALLNVWYLIRELSFCRKKKKKQTLGKGRLREAFIILRDKGNRNVITDILI